MPPYNYSLVARGRDASGNVLEIHFDQDARNPIKDEEYLAHLVLNGKYACLGEEPQHGKIGSEKFEKYLRAVRIFGGIVVPVYVYDHGNVTLSLYPFSCRWDSGQAGWAYMSRRVIDKEFHGDKKWAMDYIRSIVRTQDTWANGDVYGYKIFDPEGEELDSCWEFFRSGTYDEMLRDMQWNAPDELKGLFELKSIVNMERMEG